MRIKISRAPKLAKWLFDRIVRSEERSTVVGDIEEFFCKLREERGVLKANLWFWTQILVSLPVFIKNSIYWRGIMFRNIIKITFRNISKHKGYYFINVAGLSIGIVCFILIALFIMDELSYDRYHEKADRIYKAGVRAVWADNEFHGCVSPAPFSRALVTEFPEVEVSTRLRRFGFPVIRYKDKVFSEERWYWADETFFDDHFARLYRSEEKTGTIFFSFSLLAILIASLGLFGLTAFITQQRTKEIGIRKVLGASISGIIFLFTKQFTLWVLAANIIAWPVAYFAMNKWLQNFAYRTNLRVGTFVLSALLTLAIALLTVSFQSIRAAVANPVDSLRYE